MRVPFPAVTLFDKEAIRASRLYRWFGAPIMAPPLWRWERRPVAGGVAIGLFVAATPTLGQMFIVAFLAIWMKRHLAAALAACWITNPVTMPFIYYGEYLFGAAILSWFGVEPPQGVTATTIVGLGGGVFASLLLGSAITSLIAAGAGYGLGSLLFLGTRRDHD